jgi:hypothetical protein
LVRSRGTLDFGGERRATGVLEALKKHTSFVRLGNGGWRPAGGWLERWGALLSSGKESAGKLRFTRGRAFLLDALLAARDDLDVDAEFERMRASLRRAREPQAEDAPPGFVGELRPYQREGLGWLRFLGEAGFGGCLADDMGLGKTVQVLAYVLALRARARTSGKRRAQPGERRGPVLVVAPRSLIFNWQSEAARFTPEVDVLVHHGPARARARQPSSPWPSSCSRPTARCADVELLAKIDFGWWFSSGAGVWSHAAQAAKAAPSCAQACARADRHAGREISPTCSIFEFLNPGFLEGSRALRNLLKNAGDQLEVARLASRALRPFLLRRTKEEVLAELPPKTEQVVLCELTGAQHKEYAALREHYRRSVLGKIDELGLDRARMNVLTALLRLRQAACHLALIDPARADAPAAKLETLLPMLEEVLAAGHKALVFSQFTSFLALLRRDLGRARARLPVPRRPHARSRGQGARVQRSRLRAIRDQPQGRRRGPQPDRGRLRVLLDPGGTRPSSAGRIDRTHRIGQTRAVTLSPLVAKDTIEEGTGAAGREARARRGALRRPRPRAGRAHAPGARVVADVGR